MLSAVMFEFVSEAKYAYWFCSNKFFWKKLIIPFFMSRAECIFECSFLLVRWLLPCLPPLSLKTVLIIYTSIIWTRSSYAQALFCFPFHITYLVKCAYMFFNKPSNNFIFLKAHSYKKNEKQQKLFSHKSTILNTKIFPVGKRKMF